MSARKNSLELHSRNFIGYARNPPNVKWPNNAKVAVSFVLNYEEGGERSIEHGDAGAENYLTEALGPKLEPRRNPRVEGDFEYGSRVGIWRILNLFEENNIPITIYGVGMAMEKNPEVCKAFLDGGHEVASHGYRWIPYQDLDSESERRLIEKNLDVFRQTVGKPPVGWYYGRCSEGSRSLVASVFKEQNIPLKYNSDSYAEDYPFYVPYPGGDEGESLLIFPYTYDNNDMKFHQAAGCSGADDFYTHLKNAFDILYEEGQHGNSKMMTIGLHCRIIGKPGRFPALKRFVEYITTKTVRVYHKTKLFTSKMSEIIVKTGYLGYHEGENCRSLAGGISMPTLGNSGSRRIWKYLQEINCTVLC